MSFWRLFGPQVKILAKSRGWTSEVVGELKFQDALARQYKKNSGIGHDLKVIAVLIPERNNKVDSNAVRVEIGSQTVGYLPREAAAQYRASLNDEAGQCSAKIVGGFEMDDGTTAYYGVKLNLAWPPRFN